MTLHGVERSIWIMGSDSLIDYFMFFQSVAMIFASPWCVVVGLLDRFHDNRNDSHYYRISRSFRNAPMEVELGVYLYFMPIDDLLHGFYACRYLGDITAVGFLGGKAGRTWFY
jgi:hypothetical protein